MFKLQSLVRALAVAVVTFSGVVAAQPVSEACGGAEVITFSGLSGLSTLVDPNGAVAAPEQALSCRSAATRTVWFQFVAPATASYTVQTCTAATGTTYDTVIAVYSGSCGALTEVTGSCNNDGCSPQSTALIPLTAGTTYYVQVAAASATPAFTATSRAQVALSYVPPPANDTCSAAEAVTPNGAVPVLSTVARSVSAVAAAEEPFLCLFTPTSANRSVWYSVTPSISGDYRLENCAAAAPGNTVADTVLAVYTGTCGALTGTSQTCGDDSCGARSAVVMSMTAGTTYYVQLAKFGSTAPSVTADSLQLAVSQVVNGPGDVCSTSPELRLNEPVLLATTAAPDGGYSVAQNNAQLDGGACFTGLGQTASPATGRDVAHQFRAANAGRYTFRIGNPSSSVDALVYLTDSCIPASGAGVSTYSSSQCLGASNRNSSTTTLSEEISCVSLTANQTVYVWVDEVSQSTSGSALNLEVTPCAEETELNGTVATASALSCVVTGATNVANDVDFFALGGHPAGTRVYAMAEGAAANANNFDMRVTTDTRTLEYDDANLPPLFGTSSPVIAGAELTAEPAYLRINYSGATIAEPYILYSHVQRAPPMLEVEPNDTIATASTSATNHFLGSITDGGTDVDLFSFSATAGQLIFAALDAVPDRTDAGVTGYNFTMSLVDSTGAVLLTSDDSSTATTITSPTTPSLTATTPTFPGDGLVYRARTSGTYGIRVGKTAGTNPNPYVLSVSVGCTDTQPTLADISPVSGTPSGGQALTLTGSNFSERSVVRIGTSVAQVTAISATELIVLTPPGSAGEFPVSVTNGIGLSATLTPGYTYDDPAGLPPILTSLTPTFGPVTGGTIVTLSGTVFRRDAGVFFDVGGATVGATAVTVINSTRIRATTPPQAEGAANVTVINTDGLTSTLPASFTYEGPPQVASIVPNTGLTTGGLTITINGRNFRTGTTVRLGANLTTGVSIADGGLSLTAVTPTSPINGPVDVLVRATDTQSTTVDGGFIYAYPAPTISAVSPAQGYAVGNTLITITGTGFVTGAAVTVGGNPATSVTRTSATQVTARTPAGTPGLADVVLTNTDAQSVTRAGSFRYVAAPVVASISPTNGPVQGGTRITLTGQDFQAGATVRLGGVPAFAVTVSSSTTATAVTNANMPGPANVELVNPDLQVSSLPNAFNFDGAPLLTAISPISGTTAGGTVVTLTGAGFGAGVSVVFGARAATGVTVVSPTELTVITPARDVGVVSVTVANADGQSSSLQRAYRFVAPPTVSAIAPASGDVTGGQEVRVTGTGFTSNSTVSFGGVDSTQVALISATELSAITPAHAPGVVDVVVSADGAIATLAGAFTYTRGAPTLVEASPASGPLTGGTLLTLSGTNFAPGATVTVGGSPATDVVVVSNALARAVVPAHAAGAVDVVFTNDDAQSATLAGGFTYVAPTDTNAGTVMDGGSGSLGEDPTSTPTPGGVSCGCASVDGSMFSMVGFGLLMVLSRRRRRS